VDHDRDRVLERLDKMFEAGRVTEEEAERVRSATGSDDFEDAVRNIRVRHAREWLEEAVGNGRLTSEEAATVLERLRNGEDPSALRGLARGRPSRDRAAREEGGDD
jgi:polyhydroxyalkanoate synthesis regulator phasin